MKAEMFLKQLGLSVNIVIVILLLIIIYYLHCINKSLSIEKFIGSNFQIEIPLVKNITSTIPNIEILPSIENDNIPDCNDIMNHYNCKDVSYCNWDEEYNLCIHEHCRLLDEDTCNMSPICDLSENQMHHDTKAQEAMDRNEVCTNIRIGPGSEEAIQIRDRRNRAIEMAMGD